jgi:endonuclease YncB( thermonuclease family)
MLEIMFCLIVGITDGDTVKARCGEAGSYEQVKVRIVAIDAPERGQPWGNRSRQYLSDLCFNVNAKLTVHYSDRYGRLVADVECNDKNAGTEQVKAGMAWVYDRYAQKHQHLYAVQEEAKANRLGLWSDKNPVAPWLWRRGQR